MDDYEHMLSVIGLVRFAMGIPENIVESNELYTVEELPIEKDPQRTIQRSLLMQSTGPDGKPSNILEINGKRVKLITSKHSRVTHKVTHDRKQTTTPKIAQDESSDKRKLSAKDSE